MWLLVKNKYKKQIKQKYFYMAEMTKMFVKYNGTRSQFESVKSECIGSKIDDAIVKLFVAVLEMVL